MSLLGRTMHRNPELRLCRHLQEQEGSRCSWSSRAPSSCEKTAMKCFRVLKDVYPDNPVLLDRTDWGFVLQFRSCSLYTCWLGQLQSWFNLSGNSKKSEVPLDLRVRVKASSNLENFNQSEGLKVCIVRMLCVHKESPPRCGRVRLARISEIKTNFDTDWLT